MTLVTTIKSPSEIQKNNFLLTNSSFHTIVCIKKEKKRMPTVHKPIMGCIDIKKKEKKPTRNKFLFAIKPKIKVTIDKPIMLKVKSEKIKVG